MNKIDYSALVNCYKTRNGAVCNKPIVPHYKRNIIYATDAQLKYIDDLLKKLSDLEISTESVLMCCRNYKKDICIANNLIKKLNELIPRDGCKTRYVIRLRNRKTGERISCWADSKTPKIPNGYEYIGVIESRCVRIEE